MRYTGLRWRAKGPGKIRWCEWEVGDTPAVLSPTLRFLERQRAGDVTPETWFPTLVADSGACTPIQGCGGGRRAVSVNRDEPEESMSCSDVGL